MKIETLIIYLTTLLGNEEKSQNLVAVIQQMEDLNIFDKNEDKDSMRILAIKISSANVVNHNQFGNSTLFDIKKLGTYSKAMQGSHAIKWAKTIEKELYQLYKNEKLTLVY